MSEQAIAAINTIVGSAPLSMERLHGGLRVQAAVQTESTASASFAELLRSGVTTVNTEVLTASDIAGAFAIDDSIPPHQVMLALERAKLSMQLMMQVRARLVEGFQEFMRMQL
jgi:flagellar hook-basal body complex protein FliE